jgi:hypothetical protein
MLSKKEVIEGIRSGEIHPKSIVVAFCEISPQQIAEVTPEPGFMVGCPEKVTEAELAEAELE